MLTSARVLRQYAMVGFANGLNGEPIETVRHYERANEDQAPGDK